MKLDVKELINKVLSNMIIIKTYSGTYDRLSSDGWAGYIDNTTLGISDLTKYHWFVEDHSLWSQQPFIQEVQPTYICFRTWVINSTTNSTVTLLKNANAGAFKLVGIRKLGGVLLSSIFKAFSDFTSHLFGGDVDESQFKGRICEDFTEAAGYRDVLQRIMDSLIFFWYYSAYWVRDCTSRNVSREHQCARNKHRLVSLWALGEQLRFRAVFPLAKLIAIHDDSGVFRSGDFKSGFRIINVSHIQLSGKRSLEGIAYRLASERRCAA